MTDWLEIAIPCPVACAEDVAALLAERVEAAAAGTELRAGEIVFWVELARGETVLAEARAAIAAIAEGGLAVDAGAVHSRPAMPEEQWRDAWKRYFHTTRLTRRIVIVPSWERYTPADDDLVIDLDPGQAFGTGAHASTRLCLLEMQDLADDGFAPDRVFDVGTGSAVLAIAAVRLWPSLRGVAVDNDDIAVTAARENLEKNRVDDRIDASGTAAEDVAGTFALLLANIHAPVLLGLADVIAPRVAAGGVLILSGLLTQQAQGVADAYAARGLIIERIRRSDDDPEWSSVRLRRP